MTVATRLIGAMLVVCAVVFGAAFAYARDNRPDLEVEATPTPALATLPARSAPPAIPVLARADALPPIKVKKKPKPKKTTSSSSAVSSNTGSTGTTASTNTTGTVLPGTNTNTGQQQTNTTTNTNTNTTPKTTTQKKQDTGIQKTGSGGSVAGGGTPED